MARRVIADLLALTPFGPDVFTGPANGPVGKRAYGGHLAGQALAAACRTVDDDRTPTAFHSQFLRGGDAGTAVRYDVERVHDGRTTSSRRVLAREGDRLLVTATALFAVPAPGPQHADRPSPVEDPETLERTGPIGPAPSLPLDSRSPKPAPSASELEDLKQKGPDKGGPEWDPFDSNQTAPMEPTSRWDPSREPRPAPQNPRTKGEEGKMGNPLPDPPAPDAKDAPPRVPAKTKPAEAPVDLDELPPADSKKDDSYDGK